MKSISASRHNGFSLLEMVVAISILALSLAALYQAVSGATRNVRTDERYAYGVELARSLLARNTVIPRSGVRQQGETAGGFSWTVSSQALPARGPAVKRGALHELEVVVSWLDGRKRRDIVLNSVVEGRSRQ
jgi:general secretion pathway protein I